jgi:farnesyl-diphosphate farnesyltransferase
MDKVSRSFAVVVRFLEQPLQYQISTAYLLCRCIDNIEDCERPYEWKMQRFAEFKQMLDDPGRAREVLAGWEEEAWPGLTVEERQMMSSEYGLMLWEALERIPCAASRAIRSEALAMIEGMAHVHNPDNASFLVRGDGIQVLADEDLYNRYCYFVAGTVGHMTTELATGQYELSDTTMVRLRIICEAFGRGLQKTNIVKDFADDLGQNICYLPDDWLGEVDYSPLVLAGAPLEWKQKVVWDVMVELATATEYVLTLPYSAGGYRVACLVSLLSAYETILLAAREHDRLFTDTHDVKISRQTMGRCVQDAQKMAADNEAISAYRQQSWQSFDRAFTRPRIGLPCLSS